MAIWPPELAAPVLLKVANDPDPDVATNMVNAIAGLGDAVVPRATKALQKPQYRSFAVRVLKKLGPKAKGLPQVVDINLARFLETCQLITEFAPLPGQDRLTKSAADQRKHKSKGSLVDTNLVIFGRGTVVSQSDPNAAATSPPSPTPSKNLGRTPIPKLTQSPPIETPPDSRP